MSNNEHEFANILGKLADHYRKVADDYSGHADRMMEAKFPDTYIEFVRGRAAGMRDSAVVLEHYDREIRRIANGDGTS